mgnify:CR=1 FL=1
MMRRYGLIGRPLGHSASAAYFAEKFAREGLTECEYRLYELESIEELPALLALPGLEGLNVTIPYKRAVFPCLAALTYEAQAVGAVNCIRRSRDGRWTGHNTDLAGVRASLDELLGAGQPERALVLGTGGASQAVQFALAERGILFELVSRDPARGNFTYDDLPAETVAACRLIVHATPVGTYPAVDEAPRIPYAYVTPDHFLLDLVYNPPLTQFLDYGRQRGARVLNGERMFLTQAEASWAFWNDPR